MSFDVSPRMWFGVDEPWLARSAMEHIQSGGVVYDIGAHVGYTCLLYAQRVGDDGAVHAFEILPYVEQEFLQRTIGANRFRNITSHPVGLSNREETLSLPIGETLMTSQHAEARDGQRMEACRVLPLDEYVALHDLSLPSYMKIDIEGAEINCLIGGERTIRESTPLMMIEFHSIDLLRNGHSLLSQWGYRLVTERGESVDESMMRNLTWFHESVLCLPQSMSAS
jgi:FkbM family methyltransferase